MNYKTIDLKHVDKSVLVDDLLFKGLLAQVELIKKQNAELYKEAIAHYSEIRRLAVLVWGVGKKGYSDFSVDQMCVQVNTYSDLVVDKESYPSYNQ